MSCARILVIGAGISGVACAGALRSAGIDVTVRERGRAPGGRVASPLLRGRRVDIGASYFTVQDNVFARVVAGWQQRGLARPWTDTFSVFGEAERTTTSGAQRWAARDGLGSLVQDLHQDVMLDDEVTELPDGYAAIVLAMPDPQAARLAGDVLDRLVDWVDYQPVIAVAAAWPHRRWADLDGAFVNDDPDITLIADDGARRGDGAPVLVVHSTADLAHAHLDDPDGAVPPMIGAARRLLDIDEPPEWTRAHRWDVAKPAGTHGDAPFALTGSVGICSDSWCPEGNPRVEAAWLSGHRLGTELATRLS